MLLGEPGRVMAVQPCANVSVNPASRFELDPAALIAAWRGARAGAPSVIGHYHSHPSGDPRPSATDAAEAAGVDPCDAAPDHWRHVANRIAAGQPPRPYTLERHRAWLKRREIEG